MTDKPAESAVERYFWCEDGFICDRNAPVDGTLEDQDPTWWEVDDPCRVLNEQDAAIAELKAKLAAAEAQVEKTGRVAKRVRKLVSKAEKSLRGWYDRGDEDADAIVDAAVALGSALRGLDAIPDRKQDR